MKLIGGIIVVIVCLGTIAPKDLSAQDSTELDQAIRMIQTLCVSSARQERIEISGGIDTGFTIKRFGFGAEADAVLIDESLQGVVSGLDEWAASLSAEQASKARKCMSPYIGTLLGWIKSAPPITSQHQRSESQPLFEVLGGIVPGATTRESYWTVVGEEEIGKLYKSADEIPEIGLFGVHDAHTFPLGGEFLPYGGDLFVYLGSTFIAGERFSYTCASQDCLGHCEEYDQNISELFSRQFRTAMNIPVPVEAIINGDIFKIIKKRVVGSVGGFQYKLSVYNNQMINRVVKRYPIWSEQIPGSRAMRVGRDINGKKVPLRYEERVCLDDCEIVDTGCEFHFSISSR